MPTDWNELAMIRPHWRLSVFAAGAIIVISKRLSSAAATTGAGANVNNDATIIASSAKAKISLGFIYMSPNYSV
jgi:hypothetical protein